MSNSEQVEVTETNSTISQLLHNEAFLKWTPRLAKPWLYFIIGAVWAAVGVMLMRYSYGWLGELDFDKAIWYWLVGIIIAVTANHFGLSKIAKKNIRRIEKIVSEKPCVFAFTRWQSYPLVMLMITLGIYLRKHSALPKPILAAMYLGMGGSLFLASSHSFRRTFKK